MKRFLVFNLDFLGFLTSLFCAIHCLMLPLLTILLPVLGIAAFEHDYVELPLIALTVVFAGTSLVQSYYKIHRNFIPLFFAALGLVLLVSGHLAGDEAIEIISSAFGGCLIAVAHFKNWKLVKTFRLSTRTS